MVRLNVYVVHYTLLTERRACVDAIRDLASETDDVKVTVIEEFDPESITPEMASTVLASPTSYPEGDNPYYKDFVRRMTHRHVSNLRKHYAAYERAARAGEEELHLILEDDVVFATSIVAQVRGLVERLSADQVDWEMVFLGQPSDRQSDDRTVDIRAMSAGVVLPCCESYLMTTGCARSLQRSMLPFRFPTNIMLGYAMDKVRTKAYTVFPNIVGDGTKMGNFVSTMSPNNVLLFNNAFKEVYALLERSPGGMSVKDFERARSIMVESSKLYKDNPDMLHLEGLTYKLNGDYERAKEVFAKALELYKANHAPLGNTSLFLRNYIDTYKRDGAVP